VTQAGLFENLHRLDTMIVEEVAKKADTPSPDWGRVLLSASVSRWACRKRRSPGGPVEKEDAKTRRACGWMCS
jgi:hypothetical protein